ncbi:MAG: right-handed parallel beta-helix repeat-containing protein [Candidatus Coatesbacteria bacterium]|nr:right-handed parallel beta-helix repeat-containing protein [Candidatus Coatesbacteria bacterium]
MRYQSLLAIAAACLLLSAGSVQAADYYVDARTGADGNTGASPSVAWQTITHALASVSGTAGDPVTIYIATGTYSPSENDESFPLQMKSYVSLIGEGADTVILDAEDSAYHVIYCAEVDHLTIEGLTVTGGKASGSGTDGKGGGALFAACSDVIVQYCTISENSAWLGGGVHCDVRAGVWIEGCLVSDNSSIPDADGRSFGGGVGISGASPTVIHCSIESNSAVIGAGLICDDSSARIAWCDFLENWCIPDPDGGSWGGGIYLSEASPLIEDCVFSSNFASRGGGIQTSDSYFDVERCKFVDNDADSGAGIHTWGGGANITSCEFVNNFASWGGAISANDCLPILKNCLFALNTAQYTGGGMYVDNEAQPFITSCTFDSNSAAVFGGAVGILNSSSATFENSILWANGTEIDLYEHCSVSVSNCCVYGGYPGDKNIADDPLFVSGPEGDYYLSCVEAGQGQDSPCINAGNDMAVNCGLESLTTRTDGVADSGMVDLGYHYPTDAAGELAVYCYLNNENFAPGDTLIGQVEVDNSGPDAAVDIYVAIVLPDGAIMTLTGAGFAVGLYPWFANVTLVEGFASGAVTAFETPVPGGMDGDFLLAAALTEPGTLTYLAGPATYAFSIQTP